MNTKTERNERELSEKIRNALQLHKRGHLTANQTVRLCKQYKMEHWGR